jgi:hypothetical protein
MKTRYALRFAARFAVVWLAAVGCATFRSGDELQTRDRVAVPDDWLDLPASPFMITGSPTGPVLSNRTGEAISQLTVSCVRDSSGLVSEFKERLPLVGLRHSVALSETLRVNAG